MLMSGLMGKWVNGLIWLIGPAPISREISSIGAGSELRYDAGWL